MPNPRAGGAGRRPTMKEVAALAGVGIKTVSRVVNGEPMVTEATAQRVWDAVERLDYHLDQRAGSLRRSDGATSSIALLVSDVANPFAGVFNGAIGLKYKILQSIALSASYELSESKNSLARAGIEAEF